MQRQTPLEDMINAIKRLYDYRDDYKGMYDKHGDKYTESEIMKKIPIRELVETIKAYQQDELFKEVERAAIHAEHLGQGLEVKPIEEKAELKGIEVFQLAAIKELIIYLDGKLPRGKNNQHDVRQEALQCIDELSKALTVPVVVRLDENQLEKLISDIQGKKEEKGEEKPKRKSKKATSNERVMEDLVGQLDFIKKNAKIPNVHGHPESGHYYDGRDILKTISEHYDQLKGGRPEGVRSKLGSKLRSETEAKSNSLMGGFFKAASAVGSHMGSQSMQRVQDATFTAFQGLFFFYGEQSEKKREFKDTMDKILSVFSDKPIEREPTKKGTPTIGS